MPLPPSLRQRAIDKNVGATALRAPGHQPSASTPLRGFSQSGVPVAAAFTPGPWEFDCGLIPPDGPERYADIYVTESEGEPLIIASFNEMREFRCSEGIANAALIAAAPDLYEALEATHKLISAFAHSGFTDEDIGGQLFTNQGKIFTALRKARGEVTQP